MPDGLLSEVSRRGFEPLTFGFGERQATKKTPVFRHSRVPNIAYLHGFHNHTVQDAVHAFATFATQVGPFQVKVVRSKSHPAGT